MCITKENRTSHFHRNVSTNTKINKKPLDNYRILPKMILHVVEVLKYLVVILLETSHKSVLKTADIRLKYGNLNYKKIFDHTVCFLLNFFFCAVERDELISG